MRSVAFVAIVCTLFAFSCKKENNDENLLNYHHPKVVFYNSGSTDTVNYDYKDNISYRRDGHITQVVTTTPVPDDKHTYVFSYNGNGQVAKLKRRGHDVNFDYLFFYSVYHELDSIQVRNLDKEDGYTPTASFSYRNSYNRAISHVTVTFPFGFDKTSFTITYFRNDAGRIDSTHYEKPAILNTSGVSRTTTISNSTGATATINNEYCLVAASRFDPYLFSPGVNNIFMDQYLNPDQSVLTDFLKRTYEPQPDVLSGESNFRAAYFYQPDSLVRKITMQSGESPYFSLNFQY